MFEDRRKIELFCLVCCLVSIPTGFLYMWLMSQPPSSPVAVFAMVLLVLVLVWVLCIHTDPPIDIDAAVTAAADEGFHEIGLV